MTAKFVVEIESIKEGLNVLRANVPPGVLDMYPAGPGQRCIIPVTREQFENFSDDIRAFSTGAVPPLLDNDGSVLSPGRPSGNEITLQLHVRDLASGKRQEISFAEALEIYKAADDKAALATQKAEAERLAALTSDEDPEDDDGDEDVNDATLKPLADAASAALNVRG